MFLEGRVRPVGRGGVQVSQYCEGGLPWTGHQLDANRTAFILFRVEHGEIVCQHLLLQCPLCDHDTTSHGENGCLACQEYGAECGLYPSVTRANARFMKEVYEEG